MKFDELLQQMHLSELLNIADSCINEQLDMFEELLVSSQIQRMIYTLSMSEMPWEVSRTVFRSSPLLPDFILCGCSHIWVWRSP